MESALRDMREDGTMRIFYVSGSPRRGGNTEILLERARKITGGELLRLADIRFEPCRACWACRQGGTCAIRDELTPVLERLSNFQAPIIGSPVYFNNVTTLTKAFMNRTWPLRGRFRNLLDGAIAVGRRYGAESAITAIHAFFLKHGMVIGHRGVTGIAYRAGDVLRDREALEITDRLANRLLELASTMFPNTHFESLPSAPRRSPPQASGSFPTGAR